MYKLIEPEELRWWTRDNPMFNGLGGDKILVNIKVWMLDGSMLDKTKIYCPNPYH